MSSARAPTEFLNLIYGVAANKQWEQPPLQSHYCQLLRCKVLSGREVLRPGHLEKHPIPQPEMISPSFPHPWSHLLGKFLIVSVKRRTWRSPPGETCSDRLSLLRSPLLVLNYMHTKALSTPDAHIPCEDHPLWIILPAPLLLSCRDGLPRWCAQTARRLDRRNIKT